MDIEAGAREWIRRGVSSVLARLGLPSVKDLCQSQSHGVKELLCYLAEPLKQRLPTLAIGKA